MSLVKQIQTQNSNRNLVRYLLVILGQKRMLIAALVLLGAVSATIWVYVKGPVYEARASFLADPSIVLAQVEKLDSRDLMLKAIRRLEFVEVEYYQNKGLRGEYAFYDQSPFILHVEKFPLHLLEKEMKIVFDEKGNFQYSFEAEGQSVKLEGIPGKALASGSIRFVLNLTRFWSERFAGQTLYFRVHSPGSLASQLRKQFKVTHLLNRKNRILVQYEDANRTRALDVMRALSDIAMEEWQAENNGQMDRQLAQIQMQMEFLEKELRGARDLSSLMEAAQAEIPEVSMDSMIAEVRWREEKLAWLAQRHALLATFEKTGYGSEDFVASFAELTDSESDQTLLQTLAQRKQLISNLGEGEDLGSFKQINVQIRDEVKAIQQADSSLQMELSAANDQAETELMTNLELRRSFILQTLGQQDKPMLSTFRWETYLELFSERNKVATEFVKNQKYFGRLEAPYIVAKVHRLEQAKKIFTGMALGGILGIVIVLLTAFGASRVRSVEQLAMMSKLPVIGGMRAEGGEIEAMARKLRVNLEMQRPAEARIVALGSEVDSAVQVELARVLVEKYAEISLKMAHYAVEEGIDTQDAAGRKALANRLLSPEVTATMQQVLENHDLVLLDQAPFREYPESWMSTRQARQLIYLVHNGQTRYEDLQFLENQAAESNLQVMLVFVS